jgi:hypothetical protein
MARGDKQIKFHSGNDKIEGSQFPVLILGLAKYLSPNIVPIIIMIEHKEIIKCIVEVIEYIWKR